VKTPAAVITKHVIYPTVRTSIPSMPSHYPPQIGLVIAVGPAMPMAMKPITIKKLPSVTALNFAR
jgi:hypothetical protein